MSSRLFDPSEARRQFPGILGIVQMLPLAEPGVCHDCQQDAHRRRYGLSRSLCSTCAERRLYAAHSVLEDDEWVALVAGLQHPVRETPCECGVRPVLQGGHYVCMNTACDGYQQVCGTPA